MKTTPRTSPSLRNLGTCLLALAALALVGVAMPETASAQTTRSWASGVSGDWSDNANWTTQAPISGENLQFNVSGTYTATNDLVGFQTGTSGSVIYIGNGTVTLEGNPITLRGTFTTTQIGGGSTGTTTVNHNIILDADRFFETSRPLVINGVVSGVPGGGSKGINKIGGSTLTLNNPNNSFNGLVMLRRATTVVTKLANQGENSSLGTGASSAANSIIQIGHNNDDGALVVQNSTGAQSTNRQIRIGQNGGGSGNNATILNNNSDANNTVVFTAATFNPAQANATGTRTLTLGGSNPGNNRIDGTIQDNSASSILNVAKANAGKWTLGGDNLYTGTTTVSGGTLLVNGSHVGGGSYTVANGATLGGSGRIAPVGGATITANSGATIAPGASIGTLTVDLGGTTGGLTMNSGAKFAFEIAEDGSTPDQIAFWNYVGASDFVLNGNVIDVAVLGDPIGGYRQYTVSLFSFYSDGGDTPVDGGIVSGLTLGTLDPRIYSAALVFNGATIDLVYAVPEPSSLSLLALAGLAVLRRRKRR